MKRSDIDQPPCYFDKYINYVADVELFDAFAESLVELDRLEMSALNRVGSSAYAPGKWTLKDIFRHLIDAEHILRYRALRIGRNDPTVLSGFDEALLADNVETADDTLENLVAELKTARQSSALLFRSFSDEALQRSAVVSENRMSVLAFGFAIVGHQKYHLQIITEKYLPLGSISEL